MLKFGSHSVQNFQNWQTGKLLNESDKDTGHKKGITSLTKAADGSHFLTGSHDKSAKVSDRKRINK